MSWSTYGGTSREWQSSQQNGFQSESNTTTTWAWKQDEPSMDSSFPREFSVYAGIPRTQTSSEWVQSEWWGGAVGGYDSGHSQGSRWDAVKGWDHIVGSNGHMSYASTGRTLYVGSENTRYPSNKHGSDDVNRSSSYERHGHASYATNGNTSHASSDSNAWWASPWWHQWKGSPVSYYPSRRSEGFQDQQQNQKVPWQESQDDFEQGASRGDTPQRNGQQSSEQTSLPEQHTQRIFANSERWQPSLRTPPAESFQNGVQHSKHGDPQNADPQPSVAYHSEESKPDSHRASVPPHINAPGSYAWQSSSSGSEINASHHAAPRLQPQEIAQSDASEKSDQLSSMSLRGGNKKEIPKQRPSSVSVEHQHVQRNTSHYDAPRSQSQRNTQSDTFLSETALSTDEFGDPLPPMSLDGGNEEEFQKYWENRTPPHFPGGWVRYWSHPQVNVQPYWYRYQSGTGDISWKPPNSACVGQGTQDLNDAWVPRRGKGAVWDASVKELKQILSTPGEVKRLGMSWNELARRACFEYEQFEARVLSWHDYQYITFWFFGGMKKEQQQDKSEWKNTSFFGKDSGFGKDLFADEAFFQACASVAIERMQYIHPINLVYLMWTFVRAEIPHKELFKVAGDWFCDGRIPMFDRCSLGTIVWCYSKIQIRHDKLYDLCAKEFERPNRTRSLAPRNFQNGMIAYSRGGGYYHGMVTALAKRMPHLLDNHDPKYPKLDQRVLFSYTCKDGSEVPADCFRVSSLIVILKSFLELKAKGPEIEYLIKSMADYTRRSMERSPQWMFEPNEALRFVGVLKDAGRQQLPVAKYMEALQLPLQEMLTPEVVRRLNWRTIDQLKQAYWSVGLSFELRD